MSQTSPTNKQLKPSLSTQENPLQSSASHPKPTFKYFRRTFTLNEGRCLNAIKLNFKRIHIKKMVEADSYSGEGDEAQTNMRCLKKKLFKSLVNLDFSDFHVSYWLEEVKHARRLNKISSRLYMNYPGKVITSSRG